MSERLSNERGEQKLVSGLIIPAVGTLAIEQIQIARSDLRRRQDIVGGLIQPVELIEPPATVWCNEEAKILGMPVNTRATAVMWMHHAAYRNYDYIAGDILLVGPNDSEGYDTTVPDELTTMLTAPGNRRVEMQLEGSDEWQQHQDRFEDWLGAYAYALALDEEHQDVKAVRVRMDTEA